MADIETIRKEAAAHPAVGEVVYLDRAQCEHFGTSYWDDDADAAIAASTLLRSKDYDEHHKDLLGPLRSGTVVMARKADNGPGWFTITAVFAPFGGW